MGATANCIVSRPRLLYLGSSTRRVTTVGFYQFIRPNAPRTLEIRLWLEWRFCVDVRRGNRNALVTDKVAETMRGADARPRRGSRKDSWMSSTERGSVRAAWCHRYTIISA